MVESGTQIQIFELSGNWLCLDFINTLHDRLSDLPRELLNSYADLVLWGQEAHIVTDNSLLEEAERRPAEALVAFQRAIILREALYRIFLAIADDMLPEESDLAVLNSILSEVMAQGRIVPKTRGFEWSWAGKENALDTILWQVVRAAADLLTSEELDAVRVCAAPDCSWLFLDTSKNRSRRWCDMKSCGNRAKVRRHYERKKKS